MNQEHLAKKVEIMASRLDKQDAEIRALKHEVAEQGHAIARARDRLDLADGQVATLGNREMYRSLGAIQ